MLYAALVASDGDPPRPNCRWVKQVATAIHWIIAFLQGLDGHLERFFSLDLYCGRGDEVSITTDASIHGFGATLEVNNAIVSYMHGAYCPTDKLMMQLSDPPTSSDQQVLEDR